MCLLQSLLRKGLQILAHLRAQHRRIDRRGGDRGAGRGAVSAVSEEETEHHGEVVQDRRYKRASAKPRLNFVC